MSSSDAQSTYTYCKYAYIQCAYRVFIAMLPGLPIAMYCILHTFKGSYVVRLASVYGTYIHYWTLCCQPISINVIKP